MFRSPDVADFKAEAVNEGGLDLLVLSIEIAQGADGASVLERVGRATKASFEISPKVVLIERGTLWREFERAVKAPRFVNRRS